MKYILIDAEAMHTANPTTFDIPSSEDIARLRADHYIKVCVRYQPKKQSATSQFLIWQSVVGSEIASQTNGERFWIRLSTDPFIQKGKLFFRGVIDNDLVYTSCHGLAYGQMLTVERKH